MRDALDRFALMLDDDDAVFILAALMNFNARIGREMIVNAMRGEDVSADAEGMAKSSMLMSRIKDTAKLSRMADVADSPDDSDVREAFESFKARLFVACDDPNCTNCKN